MRRREVSVWRFTLVNRGDIRLPALCPRPHVSDAFRAKVALRGVLVPILIRPSVRHLVIQRGRLGREFGYFLIDARKASGLSLNQEPPWFPTWEAAAAALPWKVKRGKDGKPDRIVHDVPYEVIPGEGRLRWAAAHLTDLRAIPCNIVSLGDDEVEEVSGRLATASSGKLGRWE